MIYLRLVLRLNIFRDGLGRHYITDNQVKHRHQKQPPGGRKFQEMNGSVSSANQI